jgi:hypothetical protein
MNVEIHRENMKRAEEDVLVRRQSAIDQLTALKQRKDIMDSEEKTEAVPKAHLEALNFTRQPEKEEAEPEINEFDLKEKDLEKDVEDELLSEEDAKTDTFENAVVEEIEEELVTDTEIADTSQEEEISELDDIFDELEEDLDLDETLEEEFKKSGNSNDIILEMYRNGDNIITIAKELGLGVGEVKLVIDLYQGE